MGASKRDTDEHPAAARQKRQRNGIASCEAQLQPMLRFLAGGNDLLADDKFLNQLKQAFEQAEQRCRFTVPATPVDLATATSLHQFLAEHSWEHSVVVLRNLQHGQQQLCKMHEFLQSHIPAYSGLVGVQQHGPFVCKWDDQLSASGTISPADFQRLALEISEKLHCMWARFACMVGRDPADAHALSCFMEAMQAVAPSTLTPLYAPEVNPISFPFQGQHAATLLDVHLPATSLIMENWVEQGYELCGDASGCCPWSVSAISMTDQGLAGWARRGLLGLSLATGILSMAWTAALLHCEDAGWAAANYMLHGAPKVWYVVRASAWKEFLVWLRSKVPGQGMGALSFVKQVFPQMSAEEMQQLGISRVLQLPGDLVITCPGIAFHWTLSCGFSVAEAVNFYSPVPQSADSSLQAVWEQYEQYERLAAEDLGEVRCPDNKVKFQQRSDNGKDLYEELKGAGLVDGHATATPLP